MLASRSRATHRVQAGRHGRPRSLQLHRGLSLAIGQDIIRADGLAKLNGRATYVDDLAIPGVWHGGTIRTPIARGRIKHIHFAPEINWSEFVIVDHRDVPAQNAVKLIESDQPALVASEFRHKHEPVLLLAHPSPVRLREALRAVRVEVEPLPAILDPRQPVTPQLLQHRADNVFKRVDIEKGDVASELARGAILIEGEYITGAQEHVYLETQGMVAYRDAGRMVVQGSMQCPYYVLDSLTHALGRPREEFRVVQTTVGGGFGGKEDYPSLIAIHAALLAENAGVPVKIVYDRTEDMAATTKRHPSWVRHRTAIDVDGRLRAMEIDVLLDGGAYVTLSPVVLSRGCIHAAGPYACDHVRIHGEVRLTNSPPYGAFRGFGAPQTQFAVERHMDEIAARIGMDPIEFRRINLLREGQTLATGQVFRDQTDLVALMDKALDAASHAQRKSEHATHNRANRWHKRGIGLAMLFHGSGFTGSGEAYLASEVYVDGRPDGRVEVLTAQTDMGQGTTTILGQIAAHRLAISPEQVIVAQPDTSRVPNSGPTVASRTAMVVGQLVEHACDDLLAKLGADSTACRGPALAEAVRRWHAAHPGQSLRGAAQYQKPDSIKWDDQLYRGDAYAGYSWGAYVAEVEVDLRTYAVRVLDFVAAQEVGRVINPTLATGQVQGGVAQGIGWALYEDVVLEDGAMKNCQMTNYVIPASSDLPPIRVIFLEHPGHVGPAGAKGIGEMPIDGPAPAVLNAVAAAVGGALNAIPLTPERLMERLETASG